jgi:hypothetical protein
MNRWKGTKPPNIQGSATTPTVGKGLQRLLISAVVAGILTPVAQAADTAPLAMSQQESSGTIVGIVTNASQAPVAHATVTAVRTDGHGIRATVSGSDGVYSFADLPTGAWTVTAQVDGYADTSAALQVVPAKATRSDLVMIAPASSLGGALASNEVVKPAAVSIPAAVPAPAAPKAVAVNSSPTNDGLWAKLTSALYAPTPAVGTFKAADAATPAAPPPAPTVPEALQAPDPAPPGPDTQTPFADDADLGWMNGWGREPAPIFDTKFFTPEIRFDSNYLQSFNSPVDHTIVGSTEEFRSGEFQIEQVSFGGDFHWNGVKARFLSMMGLFSTTTPRNDGSDNVGQWDLKDAYKYFSEANAGYHWDVQHGLNVDVGIFVSYVGLFSYYNFDNWTYQPSFVSSNTPWFFNGMRIQWWPTQNFKIEPWFINGWQSYAKYNGDLGLGGQILWIPNENLKLVFNSYGLGDDNNTSGNTCAGNHLYAQGCENANAVNTSVPGYLSTVIGAPNPNAPAINYAHVHRIHEDDSILYRYYESHGKNGAGISKAAFTFTADIGCEYGGGVTCTNGVNKANFVGVMAYDRTWFDHDLYAITIGGGFYNNPGRYLALTPPIAGATAQTGTPYFTQNPGQKLYQWDTQLNFQYMPKDWITWWTEATFRHSDIPYWSGAGGVTPPSSNGVGQNNLLGPGGSYCQNGTPSAGPGAGSCSESGGDWYPDLRKREVIWGAGVMVRF